MVSSTRRTTTVAMLGLSLLADKATATGDYRAGGLTGVAPEDAQPYWIVPDDCADWDPNTADDSTNGFNQKVTINYDHSCFNGGNPDEDQYVVDPGDGYGASWNEDTKVMTFDAYVPNKWMQAEEKRFSAEEKALFTAGTVKKLIIKGGRAKISVELLKMVEEIRCEYSETNYSEAGKTGIDPSYSGKLTVQGLDDETYEFSNVQKLVASGTGARIDISGGNWSALKRVMAKNNGYVSLWKATAANLEAITALDGSTMDITSCTFSACKEVRASGPRAVIKASATDLSGVTQVVVDGKVAEMIIESCTLSAVRSALVFGTYANLDMDGNTLPELKVVRVDGKLATFFCDDCTAAKLDTIRVASHKARAFFRRATLNGLKSIIATAKEGDVIFKNSAADDPVGKHPTKPMEEYVGTDAQNAELSVETIYTEGSTIHLNGLTLSKLQDVFVAGQGKVDCTACEANMMKTLTVAGRDAEAKFTGSTTTVVSVTMDGKNVKADFSGSATVDSLEDLTIKGYGFDKTANPPLDYIDFDEYTCYFNGQQSSFGALKTVTVLGKACTADFNAATTMNSLTTLHSARHYAKINLGSAQTGTDGTSLRTVWADWESSIVLSSHADFTYPALTTLKATQGGKITASSISAMPALTTVTATGRSGHINGEDDDPEVQRTKKTNLAEDHQRSEIIMNDCSDLSGLVMVVAEGHGSKVSCTNCGQVGAVSIHASGPEALVDFTSASFSFDKNGATSSNLQAVFADGGTMEGAKTPLGPADAPVYATVTLTGATGLTSLTTMFAQTAGKINADETQNLAKLQFIGALEYSQIDLSDAQHAGAAVKTIQGDAKSVVTLSTTEDGMVGTHCHVEGIADTDADRFMPGYTQTQCKFSKANLLGAAGESKRLKLSKSEG